MKKIYFILSALSLSITLSAQEVKWQKDFPSDILDFLLGNDMKN